MAKMRHIALIVIQPNAVKPDALRLAPPLILTAEQASTFVAALPAALDLAQSEVAS